MVYPERLDTSYFEGTDVESTAKSLLGKVLCTNFDDQLTSGLIVETEAYKAPEDKASHAYQNRRTRRTEVMFGKPGRAYVYLCYGIHHLFNIVTGPVDVPHAILIRAIEPVAGLKYMLHRRNFKNPSFRLTSGPGSLSLALGIKSHNSGLDLSHPNSPIWIENGILDFDLVDILATPRVGVDSAGECAEWPWRFRINENAWCSPAK